MESGFVNKQAQKRLFWGLFTAFYTLFALFSAYFSLTVSEPLLSFA
jgi:hypothetical protein